MKMRAVLVPLTMLTLAAAPATNEAAKGVITVRLTAPGDSSVPVSVVVREGYIDRERGWVLGLTELLTPSSNLSIQRAHRVVPLDSGIVSTPVQFFLFGHNALAQIRAAKGRMISVSVSAPWKGFDKLSAKANSAEIRTLSGQATLTTDKQSVSKDH